MKKNLKLRKPAQEFTQTYGWSLKIATILITAVLAAAILGGCGSSKSTNSRLHRAQAGRGAASSGSSRSTSARLRPTNQGSASTSSTSLPPSGPKGSASTSSTSLPPSGPTGGDPASFACSASGYRASTSGSLSTTSDGFNALVNYESHSSGSLPYVSWSIELTYNGTTLLNETASPPDTSASSGNFAQWAALNQICIETQKYGEPIVYVLGFNGGASCCAIARVYYPASNSSYSSIDMVGQILKVEDLYGDIVVIGSDMSFACKFTDCAQAGAPVTIYQFEDQQFVNVTRGFPIQIANDAQKWWNLIQNPPSGALIEGFVAPWAADECELGKESQAWSTLDSMESSGSFNNGFGNEIGSKYLSDLKTFLAEKGYCPA